MMVTRLQPRIWFCEPWRHGLVALGILVCVAGTGGCTRIGTAVGVGSAAGLTLVQERPVGEAFSDVGVRLAVNGALMDAGFNDVFRAVSVDVVEGRVLLTGNIATTALRDQAAAMTGDLDDVREVINEIEVRAPSAAATFARDSWITTKLRGKILTDARIADINYTITTNNGVVYLIGIARSQAEIDRVVGHAGMVANVRKVISHVMLADDPARAE